MSEEPRITRPELTEAIEKARAESKEISEGTRALLRDPVESAPVRALVEALYGEDLYDSLTLSLQNYFLEVVMKVAAAVIAMPDEEPDFATQVLNELTAALGGKGDFHVGVDPTDPVQMRIVMEEMFGIARLEEMFSPDYSPEECECGHPDDRHGLIGLLEDTARDKAKVVSVFCEVVGIEQADYWRTRRQVSAE